MGIPHLLRPVQDPPRLPACATVPQCLRMWLPPSASVPMFICILNQDNKFIQQFSDFFSQFGDLGAKYSCWVSHLDPNIAITELDLRRLKKEVMYSLVPLAIFILFTLYAFCRLGVFSICNPFRCCPTPADQAESATLTPKHLFR